MAEMMAILLFVCICVVLMAGYPVAFTLGGVSLLFAGIGMLTGNHPCPTRAMQADGGAGLHMVRSDLNFILAQIKIAEADAAGQDILSLIPNIRAAMGLRTVDGSNNNLMNLNGNNNTQYGAADNVFPRVTKLIARLEKLEAQTAAEPAAAASASRPHHRRCRERSPRSARSWHPRAAC